MTTLLVRGLGNEGPGDVVGAFVGETEASADDIGNIDIDGDEATVEVADGVADDVVREMDGGRVGRSEVSVLELDDRTRTVAEYVEEYAELVELEREAEMRRHEEEIRNLSGREREAKGRALLRMSGRDEGEGLGGHLVKFVRNRSGEELPDTEISVGDLVMISKRDPLRDDNPTGTVTQVTNYSVTVAFDREPPGFVFGEGLRVDLYVNDVTFQRMREALDRLPDAEGDLADLRDVIVGLDDPAEPEPAAVDEWHDPDLNDAQREAVRRAVGAEEFHLVHGPPGTGKTTTAVEVIRQAVDRGESVLATAASNTAVDNLVEFLVGRDGDAGGRGRPTNPTESLDVVRVGHPARVTPTLREHTLDSKIEDDETYQRSRELRDEAFDLLDRQDDLTAPSGRWRRGLSDDRIRELAEEGRGSRGVPPEKIEEMAEWLDLRDEADDLFDRAERLEDEAVAETIESADVVCTTNSTAGSDVLDGHRFDRLVIDEATQATEPSCLVPLVRADRAVLAGDHRQLPPTVRSREAAEAGLDETLFERLAERHDHVRDLLDVQYRMHEDVMDFASEQFYDDELVAHESVRDRTLADFADSNDREVAPLDPAHLDVAPPDPDGPGDLPPALDPDEPLVFVNTAGADAPERSREGSTSRENPREAGVVVAYARALLDAGLPPEALAVIAPYDDQTDRVRRLLDRSGADVGGVEELEVDTVDGFQGREKEVVLVSLVRSNPDGRVGFLEETRRFNVSVTRAKRKLVVVGDADTVSTEPVYDDFASYVRRNGRVFDL